MEDLTERVKRFTSGCRTLDFLVKRNHRCCEVNAFQQLRRLSLIDRKITAWPFDGPRTITIPSLTMKILPKFCVHDGLNESGRSILL